MSSATVMHRRLWEVAVDADRIIFDDLWHVFMIHPEPPESREVHDIVGRLFDRHLSGRAAEHKLRSLADLPPAA
ncbi:MAG TPA: hypothetical protein VMG33_01530 [Steroidobacteraceae bacterium]|nr:hypothetical protein [Steroidobacteraceae bacterium]